ncbi:DUF2628 domain-containing protein [Aquabacterium soli]|uniref:DUF2628 domain-containing protein n=1 Tax=Aquabacterium soli TaxID=2493092 RepID=A0A426V7V7_9BURK|nr:DUF2628 domain-containing protein [Aquabacterium soli]
MNQPGSFATTSARASEQPGHADIQSLPVPESWKHKFLLIAKAGGPKLPNLKALSFGERFKISFNILGFLLGPLYYLAKGMWKKALSYFGAGLLFLVLAGAALDLVGQGKVADALGYGLAALFGVRANIDYYKKMVLGENGWW